MQFLKIDNNMSLSDLSDIVGFQNVDSVLALNGLKRSPNVGKALKTLTDTAKTIEMADGAEARKQRKLSIINQYSEDADVFAEVANLDESGWNVLAYTGTFEGMLKVPEWIDLPNTDDVLGNTESISGFAYNAVVSGINQGTNIDPFWFTTTSEKPISTNLKTNIPAFNWFNLPFGEVTMYSSLAGESIDFPCYPSEYSDGIKANYDTMPDMLYQYEPWQVYKGSGPRQCTFTFDMHRDMWSGDHNDGKCNALIRFCEANCYPRYNGAAVDTATVTMYFRGRALVSGILTDVTPNWDTESPIGHDGFYLHVRLSLTIVEVSQQKLDFDVYRAKELIG